MSGRAVRAQGDCSHSLQEPSEAAEEPWVSDEAQISGIRPRHVSTKADLRALVDTYHAFIWRSLRRLGVPAADVDDAVQQVFLVVARRLDEIEEGREQAFLFGTATRIAANVRRASSRRPEISAGDILDQVVSSQPTAEEELHNKSDRALLEEVLEPLTLDLRTVFVLFEFEEMTTVQIASLLEIPMGTVASRIRRAREIVERQVRLIRARIAFEGGAR